MDRHSIRYLFEHRILPQYFFEGKKSFVSLLINKKEILFEIISTLFNDEQILNPYSPEDYKVTMQKVTDEVRMIKMEFPKPEEQPLCYCAYMFLDDTFHKISYFCIERGNSEDNEYPFVCSWTPDGAHHNYGMCALDNYDDFFKCADIHMEQEYGVKK